MYEAQVKRAFICKHTDKPHKRRDTYRHDDLARMQELAERGRIDFKAPAGDGPVHVGAGYYVLPDGSKIRGKEAAMEAYRALGGE